MNRQQTAIVLLKLALERGLGRKNLTAATVRENILFFKLKNTNYCVGVADLSVFKVNHEEEGTRLFIDDYSMMIQQYLENTLNDENELVKLTDNYLKGA
jgi:hypothetical protein